MRDVSLSDVSRNVPALKPYLANPKPMKPQLLAGFLLWVASPFASAETFSDASGGYTKLIGEHFDRVIASGTDRYGKDQSALWLASVDIHTGGQPEKADPAVKRTYREIHSPRGSNLYWDQTYVAAAIALSERTGDPRYKKAAEDYIKAFYDRCVSKDNGLFLWGNHIYYDVFKDQVIYFSGGHHEARPMPCAWKMFWDVSQEKTERSIRTLGLQHIKDPKTGLFCRHADVKATKPPKGGDHSTHPFLEAGGVIVESLAWLYANGGKDEALKEQALKAARFSFSHRGEKTGLLRNQPGPEKRWDYYASTTECGLWAGCLLRSADLTGEQEFVTMARDAVAAYLKYGYDASSGRFYGQLKVEDGKHNTPKRTANDGDETVYQPGEFADLWEPLFPTHNYPMSMAEACLTLWEKTKDERFKEATLRFARFIAISTPANDGKGAYADQYGRCIHFLIRAADVLDDRALFDQAVALSKEAVGRLHVPEAKMFRSHPGEDRCDAVDGMGMLFLSLLQLESGKEPDAQGFGW